MGVSLNHPSDQSVNWAGNVDSNWTQIESVYHGALNVDTLSYFFTGTTEQTLTPSTTINANSVAAGTVLNAYSAGTLFVPALATGSVTLRLRWGGLSGVLLGTGTITPPSSG